MDTLIYKIGGSLLRHMLTGLAGTLITAGYINESDGTQAVGAIMALVGIAWSAYQKHGQVKEVQAAAYSVSPQGSLDLKGPISHAPGDGD